MKPLNVRSFDQAFFRHIGHISKNIIRALLLGVSNGGIASSPVNGFEARYYRDINRFSAAFALISDVALGTLGDALKRKEYLSGRLSDAFSWMFLATAALKHFYDNGRPESERAMLDWACTHAINEIETALLGVLANLPNRFASRVTKILTFPFGSRYSPLTDSQIDAVAEAITTNIEARNAVTAEIFIPGPDDPGLGALEHVFTRTLAAGPARNKLDQARREGKLAEDNVIAMTNEAVKEGILSEAEKTLIEEVEQLREAIIQVSDFDQVTYDQLK